MYRRIAFTTIISILGASVLLAQQQMQLDLRGATNPGVLPGTPVLLAERGDAVVVAAVLGDFALELREHDRILTIDGTPVTSREQAADLYLQVDPGSTVTIDVLRDGEERSVGGSKPPIAAGPGLQVITAEEAIARGFINEADVSDGGFRAEPGTAVSDGRVSPPGEVVETRVFSDLPSLRAAPWRELARDPAGDGASPTGPDVTALSFWFDSDAQTVWIRLELVAPAPPSGFGVNVVIDADENQSTGSPWWGGNRSFTYERYVTVWVEREDDRLSGVIGVGDARGQAMAAYNNLETGGVEVAIDDEGAAVMIGIARSSFDDDLRANIIAAVGTPSSWNDDIVDRGHVAIPHR